MFCMQALNLLRHSMPEEVGHQLFIRSIVLLIQDIHRSWKTGHNRLCPMFMLVDARAQMPEMKRLIAELPRGFVAGYLAHQP